MWVGVPKYTTRNQRKIFPVIKCIESSDVILANYIAHRLLIFDKYLSRSHRI